MNSIEFPSTSEAGSKAGAVNGNTEHATHPLQHPFWNMVEVGEKSELEWVLIPQVWVFFKLPVNQMVIGQECGESIQALVGAYSYHINYPKVYFSGHASLCLST